MSTFDNQLEQQTSGQADWDSGLNANFTILERGYHATVQFGADVNTGYVLWINSGGFAFHFNPNSEDIFPHAIAITGGSSGDTKQVLISGIMRSLDIHSPATPGQDLFVSAATEGLVVGSYSAASRRIGWGVSQSGLYFNPHGNRGEIEQLTRVESFLAVTGSLHNFALDVGKRGWVREVRMIGASADLVSLTFWSGSSRVGSERLFETISGGVTVVGSHLDRAGWPYENTEANTLSGLVFGRLQVMSAAAVGSDTISVRLIVDRFR